MIAGGSSSTRTTASVTNNVPVSLWKKAVSPNPPMPSEGVRRGWVERVGGEWVLVGCGERVG